MLYIVRRHGVPELDLDRKHPVVMTHHDQVHFVTAGIGSEMSHLCLGGLCVGTGSKTCAPASCTTNGDCGTGLEIYRWKQNVTTTDLDGLHDVKVIVESARTGQAICELQTLIFEVPVSREAGKSKDAKAVKKGGGQ